MDDFSSRRVNNMQHSVSAKEKQIWLWHHRLGHPSFSYMKHLFPQLFSNLNYSDFKCDTCILAKIHCVPFPISPNKCDIPFVLIHYDVQGPSPIITVSSIRWFVTFVNDCTGMTWLYLLKHKDEAFGVFHAFHAMIKNQFSSKVRVLKSDNGGEYVNQDFQAYFQLNGLLHETSCAQNPQQNGVVERKNRHILETTRALLIGTKVPGRHQDDVVVTTVHLLNQMPSKVLHFKTPLQALSNHVNLPSILLIPPCIFECVAFVHLQKNQQTKLDPCTIHCIFLWYATKKKKGYRCYNPSTKCTYVTMDVTFLESENYYSSTVSTSRLQGETCDAEQKWWDCPRLEEVQETGLAPESGKEIRGGNEVVTVEENKEDSVESEEGST